MMDRSHELFVRFVDQMASGRFYEAHESMERLWALCGYEPASPYRGLTQLAVALAHLEKENFEGAQSVLAKLERFYLKMKQTSNLLWKKCRGELIVASHPMPESISSPKNVRLFRKSTMKKMAAIPGSPSPGGGPCIMSGIVICLTKT